MRRLGRGNALPLGALAVLACLATPSGAAAAGGELHGVVRDGASQPVSGASVRLTAPDGHVVGVATTDSHGGYRIGPAAPGSYSVQAEAPGFAGAARPVTLVPEASAAADLTLNPAMLEVTVTAPRIAERSTVERRIGAASYSITNESIKAQPGGENAGLNKVLLQTPGVSQDSFGQIHIRNEHANIQYEINGVLMPQGVSFFGQNLLSSLVSQMDVITGAMPAQFGLQTAGIVDIQTKSGTFAQGGSIGLYGGSYGWMEPSVEYAGSVGHINYYVAGDYTQDGIGIENPTASYSPIHDNTQQGHGFAYLEDNIEPGTKLSAFLGLYRGLFQIPDIPGQTPAFPVNGNANFNSATLNETQQENSDYAILSYLKTGTDYQYQVSGFSQYSSLSFQPDPFGDLAFNGIAQSAYRRSLANGIQADGSYNLTPDHTIRSGALVTGERAVSATSSLVELAGGPSTPFSIDQSSGKTGWTYSAYLQDEWRLTKTVTVNYGGRFDVLNAYTNENQLSPRANVVWQPTSSSTLHAGYANYFTPPPLELVSTEAIGAFAGTTAASAVTQNSAVRAERAQVFDIGIDQVFLPGLKGGIDAYYKYARNLIDEGQFGAPIILTPFNYQIGQNHGVEFTAAYDTSNFSGYANLAVAEQRAKGISSAQFNFSPAELAYIDSNTISTDHSQSITGSGGVSYLWQGTRFSADAIAGTGLRTGFANISALPSYEQVNFGVSHSFTAPGGPVTIRLDLINVLDQIYEIRSGVGVGVFAPQYGPRRSAFLGLRKDF